LWSGLYPSKKHLAWLLCSGIIHDRLAAASGAFHLHWADRAASKGEQQTHKDIDIEEPFFKSSAVRAKIDNYATPLQ